MIQRVILFYRTLVQEKLDVNGGIAANGQNVQQYTKNMTAAQKWVAVPNEEGTIILYSALGKKLVLK